MITAWIAGDCWLKPGEGTTDLRELYGNFRPDLLILNLECAVPAGPVRTGRRALLPLDANRLSELAIAENTVCIVANNHISDFGSEGVLATLRALRQAGIRSAGAGVSLAEARAPVIVEVAGRRIGLLAYADTAPHVGAVAATDQAPGVAPLIPQTIIADLRGLASQVDDAWLFLHWGREYSRYPEPEQRDLARAFAEAGAHLIAGVHPHVVCGKERITNALVYYSLGNFLFPPIPLADGAILHWDQVSRQGLTLMGIFEGRDWRWLDILHVTSEDGRPHLPVPPAERSMTHEFARLSASFTDGYARKYSSIRWRENLLHAARRLWMMTWPERVRLLGRLARAAHVVHE